MVIQIHHSFILRPCISATPSNNPSMISKDNTALEKPDEENDETNQINSSPVVSPSKKPQGLMVLRHKELTRPPEWSQFGLRSQVIRQPLLRKVLSGDPSSPICGIDEAFLRREFEPPTDDEYWKGRCLKWQNICQRSNKRIRDMEEDQRQLRRRIHELEERLTLRNNNGSTDTSQTNNAISAVSPARSQPPTMVVTIPKKTEDSCFYLADCEGMSDVEDYDYGNDNQDDSDDEE